MTIDYPQPPNQPQTMPAGWYPMPGDPPGMTRWWDGRQWGQQTQQVMPQPGYAPMPYAPPGYAPPPYMMVTSAHKNTSHGLHLFLTIVTGGLWGVFVWLPLTIWHRSHKGEHTYTRIGY